ncbi:hypothetical protein BUALT_Bualt13G0117000 [Buddleja alternifolia]|uniref:Uncharacterized protein n=1 Tax=Buddleja alternifolia TaxID=168488 RepID=A0AAV6WXQ9_9LAMI|nr:hypothetical protein BUALT_Bualt13G0117000 [Buddleja alternifolia]
MNDSFPDDVNVLNFFDCLLYDAASKFDAKGVNDEMVTNRSNNDIDRDHSDYDVDRMQLIGQDDHMQSTSQVDHMQLTDHTQLLHDLGDSETLLNLTQSNFLNQNSDYERSIALRKTDRISKVHSHLSDYDPSLFSSMVLNSSCSYPLSEFLSYDHLALAEYRAMPPLVVVIHISANLVFHERTTHVKINCHVVKDLIKDGTIATRFVHSEDQLADLFTKALTKAHHSHLEEKLGLLDIPRPISLKGRVKRAISLL